MKWQWKQIVPSLSQCFLASFGVVCIASSSLLMPGINEKRSFYDLTQNKPLENAPPELVLATTALGGLRGLIIDYLWLRATELRNQGSHYEIIQLYDWIGKLEPRIPEVWSFTAAEMAYNISVTITVSDERWLQSAEERWKWIRKAIEHLRDYGIPYNQKTPRLYRELAHLLYDKMETTSMDECHFYYQQQWFRMWHEILGAHPNLKQIREAPRDYAALQKDPQVRGILEKMKAAGILLENLLLFSRLSEEQRKMVTEWAQEQGQKESIHKIVNYLRARQLEKNNMDPGKMLQIEEKYGSLDWRMVSPHTIYWAEEGVKVIGERPELKDTSDYYNLDRWVFLGLKQNFEYGRFAGMTAHRIVCIPNFSVLDKLNQMFEEVQKKWEEEKGLDSHRHFLQQAVVLCYLYNQKEKAQKYFEILRKKFDHPNFQRDLDHFVVMEIGQHIDWGVRHIGEEYMTRMQLEAYMNLINGIDERYEGLSRLVIAMYKRYVERHGNLEMANQAERPLPLEHFHRTAATLLKKTVKSQQGEEMWNAIEKKFTFLAGLAKE